MIITSYVFGDIFSYQDDNYIFLASTSEQLFAAKIVKKEVLESHGVPIKLQELMDNIEV